VDSWIQRIAEHDAAQTTSTAERLRYAIDIEESAGLRRFHLHARIGTREYGLHNLATGSAVFLTPFDRTIGRLATASGLIGMGNERSPAILAMLVDVLASDGRLHWRSAAQPALVRVAIDDARIAWNAGDDGLQRPQLAQHPHAVLLPTAPLWYADPHAGTAGPARVAAPADLAALLAQAPALTAAQAERAQVALHRIFASAGVDGPATGLSLRVDERDPQPVLRLSSLQTGVPVARVMFAYDETLLSPNDPQREVRTEDADGVRVWPRRGTFEKRAQERMRGLAGIGQRRSLAALSQQRYRAVTR
jgi:hypothetical protein